MIIWITGAPGTGKTTLAHEMAKTQDRAVILDGDAVRQWLTPDCGFSPEDRLKHARRVWEVARLISEAGGTAIVALVAHPPAPVDQLIWVDGPSRRPLWPGTTYTPPEHPDLVVRTHESGRVNMTTLWSSVVCTEVLAFLRTVAQNCDNDPDREKLGSADSGPFCSVHGTGDHVIAARALLARLEHPVVRT